MSYHVCPAPRPAGACRPDETGLTLARRLFERYHGYRPDAIVRHCLETSRPRVLVRLGELRGVIYRSDRGQCGEPRTFIHFFQKPPWLTCDPEGRRLEIMGGCYRVTRAGIVG